MDLASIGSTGLVYLSLTSGDSSGTGTVLKANRGSTSCPLATASTRTALVSATKTLPLQYLKNNDQLLLDESDSMWPKASNFTCNTANVDRHTSWYAFQSGYCAALRSGLNDAAKIPSMLHVPLL